MACMRLLGLVGGRCIFILSHIIILRDILSSQTIRYVFVANAFSTTPTTGTTAAVATTLGRERRTSPFRSRYCKDRSRVIPQCTVHESAIRAGGYDAMETSVSEKRMKVKVSGREVVEAAATRLRPVFEEVDRHTQR